MPWYKFNVDSYTVRVWDSLFAFVILLNIIWAPLAIAFEKDLKQTEEGVNLNTIYQINNGLWFVAFFINLNRVDFPRHIYSFEETSKAYLRSPFLIPDLISLFGSVISHLLHEPVTGHYFELIRLFHFKKTLWPLNQLI